MSVAPERPPAASASPSGDAPPAPSLARSLLRTARPKQWAKNVLVFAAPGAAGVLTEADELGRTLAAFVAFCLAASGTYFLNDALDADADRRHPTKRNRPVAAGYVSESLAKAMAVVLVVVALAVAAPFNSGKLALVVGGYIAITVAYSLWLKHEPVVDLGAVASGFVLRAIAGGVATDVPLSDWFLIVAGAGSLFIVTGKRHAEQMELGDASAGHRSTLAEYSSAYLNYVRAVTSGVAITAYCLWAFENAEAVGDVFWFRLSIVPFVAGILRYALVVEQGGGGAPEEIVLRDRVLQLFGLMWVATFAVGVSLD
ncbi:MAG TPA: decaprenyl-phosphate phosphoribosyltransferase [Acidimicrobiia bacterium]|nr:decaprenyl-phosphate phosphoribosyltransferase [Acidimicrobiia bacterium]